AVDDVVESNEVTGSSRYGIVVVATVDRGTNWLPSGNRITKNLVSGSGTADLAIAAGGGANNCFEADNQATTTEPAGLVGTCVAEGEGSDAVAAELMRPPPELQDGMPVPPNYSTMPEPPPQDQLLYSPPPDPTSILLMGILAILFFIAGVVCFYLARPKSMLDARDLGNQALRNVGTGLIIFSILALLFIGLQLAAGTG
ncbi:MAG TPA: hypothetical protein VJS87_00055, partial [Solirubrobacterales bacterium]|nr:hypothetical protein [Solirubrobacterales bacterium]